MRAGSQMIRRVTVKGDAIRAQLHRTLIGEAHGHGGLTIDVDADLVASALGTCDRIALRKFIILPHKTRFFSVLLYD